MAGTHRRKNRRVLTVSAWLGAGVTTAGVGAALIGGAAVAQASPSADSSSPSSSSSTSGSSNDGTATKAAAKNSDNPGKKSREKALKRSASTNKAPRATAATPADTSSTAKPADEPSTTKSDTAVATESTTVKNSTPTSTGTKALNRALTDVARHLGVAPAAPAAPATTDAPVATPAANNTATTSAAATGTASVSAAANAAANSASSIATPPLGSFNPNPAAPAGTYTTLALQQIADAKAQLNALTWGAGNVFAGLATMGAQYDLDAAKRALTKWQTDNPTQMAAVAANAGNPLAQAWAKMVLKNTQQLPGYAVFMLKSAANSASLLDWFGVSKADEASATGLLKEAATNARVYGVVPMTIFAGTEPIVYIKVNGGKSVPVLVDTGSSGLVIGRKNVGSTNLGDPTGSGSGAYAGGLNYNFSTYTTTVDFGNGIVTAPTSVNVVSLDTESAFDNFLRGNGVVGVLGIGANAVGPGPSIVTSALPGELAGGVLIDTANRKLVFGPNSLPAKFSVPASPYVLGSVSVNGGSQQPLWLLLDSGGVTGTLPTTVFPSGTAGSYAPSGTQINVYGPDGTLLYSYKTTGSNSPVVTGDAYQSIQMNTGFEPFDQSPIYIGYYTPDGSTVFDY